MNDKITSLDVARRAGVSQSAVSRVFSGASASKSTTAKVRKAAEELRYRPNPLARAMITGKSRIIGLVVAYLDNQFYPLALERLSASLQAKGYHILVFLASNAEQDISKVMQELLDMIAFGLQGRRQPLQRQRVELIVEVGHDQPDDPAFARDHGASQRVWPVAQLFRCLAHLGRC